MIIAVDTGGTKTLITSFDRDGTMQVIAKFPTPKDTTAYKTAVSSAILEHADSSTIDAIVVAVPGPVVDDVLVRARNIDESWQQLSIAALFEGVFGDTPLYIANDADLAGLSEARALEQAPAVSLYVTLSTGVGTGLAFDGHLADNLRHIEGGWMRLYYDGSYQMWENFASGRNFYERYNQYGSDVEDPEKWRDFAKRASAGLVALIPMLSPDHVVIGGSMGTHFAKYGSFLREEVASVLPDFDANTITQAKHPEEAVIYGCYYYAVDRLAA